MVARFVASGNDFILMINEEFLHGYQAEHPAYMAKRSPDPCSDEQLATPFLEKLESVTQNSLSGSGLAVGWLGTLAKKEVALVLAFATPLRFAQ